MKLAPLLFALAACSDSPPASNDPAPAATKPSEKPAETKPPPKPVAKPVAPAITQEQAKAFGEALATAMNGCDAAAIDGMFDNPALMERIAKVAPAMRGQSMQFGDAMCSSLPKGSSARFLRVVEVKGEVRPRLRSLVNGGVNYLEPMLARRGDKVVAIDMYSVRNGEPMSVVIGFAGSLLAMPNGEEVARTFVEMSQLFGQGEHEAARAKYRALPAQARAIKSVALFGLSIDAKLDEASYLTAIESFEKMFPNDSSTPLVKIDYFALTKRTPDLIKTLDELARLVGGDPYLLVMRAQAHRDAKDHAAAVTDAKAALAEEPTLTMAADALLDAAVDAKDYPSAIEALDQIVTSGATKPEVDKLARSDARYRGLVKSPEYVTWMGGKPAAANKPAAIKKPAPQKRPNPADDAF